ncbi:GLUG motif-containing protein [Segatella sp.]
MGGAWAQTTKRPASGNGEVDSPYIITTAEELKWFRDEVNRGRNNICAKIADNVEVIDMSTVCHAADKSQNLEEVSWEPIGNTTNKYMGTFDGNNKTITNLYINANQEYSGLFGYTYISTIKNLTFVNANVTNTNSFTGILVGYGYGGTYQNIMTSTSCEVNGGDGTGGIAGKLAGNAYNCVNYATVQGKEQVGGLFSSYDSSKSITACANYGKVTASSLWVGGLVGYFKSGTIQDCANYGDVKGANCVAGMVGFVDQGKIQNVFSYGNVSATMSTQNIGMAFGSGSGTTEGMVAYYSGAKLTANGQEKDVKAFGSGTPSEDNATGFTEAQLKSGVVAYQLQQNASSEAKWGQNLTNDGDFYPVIGSEHTVYADNSLVNCKTHEKISGSFTNNPSSSAIRYKHGATIHHAAANATCTEAATKEYWQCQDCQRIYSDCQLTVELTDVTDAEHPALGHDNNEDGYCKRCQHYVAVKPSQENGVYLIAKPCHLAWFRDYVNGTIVDKGEVAGTTHPSASAKLTADINLTNYCHAAEDGKELLSWIPIGNYSNRWKGNMNGQGHTISNLYIKTAQNYVGLFGYTERATIQDLIFDYAKVENVNTTNTKTDYTGILAGYADGVSPSHIRGIKTTNNCTVIGQEHTGGIVGGAGINLENCENHSSVKGTSDVGGIAGSSTYENIKCCTNYGTVENNNSYIGGIIGYAWYTSIEDCANYGKITSTGWKAGGIAGQTFGNSRIQNVFSYGDVTNTNDKPGIIIGYVRGTLTAKGIVAYNKEALLNNSFVDINNIVGTGTLTFDDGKVEADVVKAFTKQQIESGEVAYLLAEGKVLGEQVWGQQLGKDQYPVPGSDYKVIKAAQGDKDANGNDTYWATFSNQTNDVTLSVPSESGRTLNVYNATVSGGKLTLTQRSDYQVAKEEGVLLKTNGEYVNAKANETNDLTKVSSDVNHLVATPAEAQIVTAAGCKLYRLTYNKAEKKEGLGFYLGVDDGTSLKATPGKAYLQISEKEAKDPSSAAPARSFVFGGGNETTGIEGITIMGTDVQRHGTIEGIFDLQGRKIVNPTKGIYIKNNKKVVIK